MDQGGSDKPQHKNKKKKGQGQQQQAGQQQGGPQKQQQAGQQQGGQQKHQQQQQAGQQQGGQQKHQQQQQAGQQQGGQQKYHQQQQAGQQQGGQQKHQQAGQQKQQQAGQQQGGQQKHQQQQQAGQQQGGQQKHQQQGGQQKQQQQAGQQQGGQQKHQQQQQAGQQQGGQQKHQQQQQAGQQQGGQQKHQQQGGQQKQQQAGQQKQQHEGQQQQQNQGKGQQQQKANASKSQFPPVQMPQQGGMQQQQFPPVQMPQTQQQPQIVRMPQPQQQPSEKSEGKQKGASDWECPSCKNINFAKKKVCNRCKVPKPEIVPPAAVQQPMSAAPMTQPTVSDQPGPSRQSSPVTEIKKDLSKLAVSGRMKSPYPVLVDPNGSKWQGTRGKKFPVEVNFLPIILENLPDIAYHYDVTFEPDRPKKFYQDALNNFQAKHFNKTSFAFDGKKNVYTAHELPKPEMEDSIEVNDLLRGQKKTYKITLKYAATIDMRVLRVYNLAGFQNMEKPSQALQCLDIVLRTIFKINNAGVTAGRSIYYKPNNYMDLGLGMELWLGLFQSAILGRKQIYLNVDVSHKAFPSAMPVERAAELYYDRNNRLNIDAFEKYLKTIDIEYRCNEIKKTFGFNSLKDSARNQTFVLEDGAKMTVEQYFKLKRGYQLKRPDLPCLHVGSKIRNVYLPMELCYIPAGQATNMKCPPECVAKMIRYSATSTEERKSKIVNLLKNIDYQKSKAICDFGLKINKTFENVEARVIDPPLIEYKNGTRVQVRKGVWRNETFIEPDIKLIKWAILKCDERIHKNDIQKLKSELLNQASKHQIRLDPNVMEESVDMMRPRPNELETKLDNLKKRGIEFVVVIIIDRNDCYARVKQAAEIKVGILTQCIKSFTLSRKMDPSTVGNILLKVNAKLNGVNHKLIEHAYNSSQVGTMFVGGDVTHPSPDQRDIPSVVGVAASYDVTGFKYNCSWRLQGPRVEMIKDFENIMIDHLNFYRQKNGQFPNRIFYYRDGVSDGQFQEVLDEELCALKKAGARLKCNPKITFIIVQKRHHTRFFPDKRFGDGRNNNVQAGTVVDKDIVHPHQYQFFLASHAAIQGVTKPTKYCVIYDENQINADYMEHLTYSLCHLFTRCNRAVSYTAPTYYAHLVAARGKQYIIGRRVDINNLDREYNQRKISNEIINNFPMFFV